MSTAKQLLEKELPAIIEKGYTEACYYFQVVSYRKVIFKGFYNSNVYQQILSNQEILANLGADTPRLKKILAEELENILLSKGGVALPTQWETWIILNPFYLELGTSPKLIIGLAEIVAHETAHAVIFNWDIQRGHAEPHAEIAKYLKDYYWRTYDWEKLLKEIKPKK